MILSTYFWTAVGFCYFSLLILVADLWFEPFSRLVKAALLLILISFGVFGSIVFVFPSAPLDIQMIRHRGDFKDGEIIGGIPWTSNYSELRVSFINQSEQTYDDVNMLIRSDLLVAKTGWITNPSNCSINLQSDLLDWRLSSTDKKTGKHVEYPLLDLASKGSYQMHCDKLLPHLPVQIVFALLSGKIQNLDEADITKPESLFGHKKLPEWAKVNGSYKMQIRPYTVSKREKLTGD